MAQVDLNCDLGEGAPHDAELMPLISSANIACGGHAGDDETMSVTVKLALQHGVVIGAHPGYADRASFGRVEIELAPEAIRALVLEQTERLMTIAGRHSARVRHVKPHGALYNLAARDAAVARAVAEAVYEADPRFVLVGLAGSRLIDAGAACGLSTRSEVFADRTYQADGTLTPRSQPNALITEEQLAVEQVLRMVQDGRVKAVDGSEVSIRADTICLHGDGDHAVSFAKIIHAALVAAGFSIKKVPA